MKINSITLYNYGSYDGLNVIDTNVSKEKNIVLFGGKNGAGKTTLFSSIGICMYGHISMGFQNFNNKYTNKIKSIFNNNAKIRGDKEAFVKLDISLESGRDIDNYTLLRKWIIDKEVKEEYVVYKNDCLLDKYQIADFEKYLLSLIPPVLFKLYFFDGEKITDFFVNEEGNKRLKEAFLILCGYDNFDIMAKNFKRLEGGLKAKDKEYEQYSNLKNQLNSLKNDIDNKINRKKEIEVELKDIDRFILEIDKRFDLSRNITENEWKNKEEEIKIEEKKREEWNYAIKKYSNDVIPFLIIKDKILELKEQIESEEKTSRIKNFIETLNSTPFQEYFKSLKSKTYINKELNDLAENLINSCDDKVLDFSYEQKITVLSQINQIINFDEKIISQLKQNIKKSISKTQKIRFEMNRLTTTGSNEYIKQKMELLSKKNQLLVETNDLGEDLNELQAKHKEIENEFNKAQTLLTDLLKKQSINNVSVKSLLMLDKLQDKLYKNQIRRLEEDFKKNVLILLDKKDLVSEISIDENFKIHVYQKTLISANKVAAVYDSKGLYFERIINEKSLKEIKSLVGGEDIYKKLLKMGNKKIEISTEIDFEGLSAGERQMFIMSLYLSLVKLGNIQIPFVIDTPFARIDLEHRKNISKNFFSLLDGQIFILSTNKEIDSEHVKIIKKNVSKFYTLINKVKSKTEIIDNYYFGVKI